jgi:carbon monoxide dehydrogenase subunit G
MELIQASRPTQVEYRGSATIAGSPLRMGINFSVNPRAEMTDVTWQGEVTLEGILALVAGNGLETMGRQNFDRMAQRLRLSLQDEQHADDEKKGVELAPEGFDFEI